MGFKLVVAMVGMYLFYRVVVFLLSKSELINVGKVGRNSLGIYILNFPIVALLTQLNTSENIVLIIFLSIVALVLCHFLSLYLSRIKYISLLFGVKV
jgi:hypothetical protein